MSIWLDYKTFAEILDLRCINGKNTLNGIDEWCQNHNQNPQFNLPAYPCGPLAATMMTDNFEICPNVVPRNAAGTYEGADFNGCLDIQIHDYPDLWRFGPFNVLSTHFILNISYAIDILRLVKLVILLIFESNIP